MYENRWSSYTTLSALLISSIVNPCQWTRVFIRARMHMFVMVQPLPSPPSEPFESCTTRDTFFFPTTLPLLPFFLLFAFTLPTNKQLSKNLKRRLCLCPWVWKEWPNGHIFFFLFLRHPNETIRVSHFLLGKPWYPPQPVLFLPLTQKSYTDTQSEPACPIFSCSPFEEGSRPLRSIAVDQEKV